MKRPTDEQLSAYLDGELSSDDAAHVAAAIEAEPETGERYAALRRVHDEAKALHAEVLDEAPPAALVAALRAASLPAVSRRLGLWQRLLRDSGMRGVGLAHPAFAVAALGLVLLVGTAGGIAGWQITKDGASSNGARPLLAAGPLEPGTPVAEALTSTASGQSIERASIRIELIATVRGEAGQICREFRASDRAIAGEAAVGVACLGSGQRWVVELVALEESAPAEFEVFVPARSAVAQAIEFYFAETIRGETLALDDEAALMKSGWPSAPRPLPQLPENQDP